MENMVTSELKKQEEFLRNSFREKYKLPDDEIDNIISDIEKVIDQMINLVKEGKSAHEKFFSDIFRT